MATKKAKKTTAKPVKKTTKKPASKPVKKTTKKSNASGKTLVLVGAVIAILGAFLWSRYLPLIGGILVLLGEFSKK